MPLGYHKCHAMIDPYVQIVYLHVSCMSRMLNANIFDHRVLERDGMPR
jgi:hypothetical protein